MGYTAVSAIKYSDPKDPNAEVVTFEAGETVEGLPVDVMKELWTAGALVKEEEAVSEPEETTTDETTEPAADEAGAGEGAADDATTDESAPE